MCEEFEKGNLCINDPARFRFEMIIILGGMIRSASTLVLSTDDESESGGCWLHPGVSPPGDAVLQLDDESNSALESGCMFSSKINKLINLKKNHCIKI